jgi:hypothetical protein
LSNKAVLFNVKTTDFLVAIPCSTVGGAHVSEPYVLSNFRVKMYRFKNRLGDTGNLQGRWSWNSRRGNEKEKGRSQWEEIKTVF